MYYTPYTLYAYRITELKNSIVKVGWPCIWRGSSFEFRILSQFLSTSSHGHLHIVRVYYFKMVSKIAIVILFFSLIQFVCFCGHWTSSFLLDFFFSFFLSTVFLRVRAKRMAFGCFLSLSLFIEFMFDSKWQQLLNNTHIHTNYTNTYNILYCAYNFWRHFHKTQPHLFLPSS